MTPRKRGESAMNQNRQVPDRANVTARFGRRVTRVSLACAVALVLAGCVTTEADPRPAAPEPQRIRLPSNPADLADHPISAHHSWVPDSLGSGPPYNVGQMWSRFARAVQNNESAEPDFDLAVKRHRLLDAIQRASDTGQRQKV